MVKSDDFFSDATEQSKVKIRIVSKYFKAWTNVMVPMAKKMSNKLNYIDLFAGPGLYEDGTESTPILIFKQVIQDPILSSMLVSILNDKNSDNINSLKENINSLPGIENLQYKPRFSNAEVDDKIAEQLEKLKLNPTLFFLDPWGYKGISRRLIQAVIKDWGCDCIFFFNFKRIVPGIHNDKFQEHMKAFFGQDRLDKLNKTLKNYDTYYKKEMVVLEFLSQSLKEIGAQFVLPFSFADISQKKTSHHIIFVSKDFKGYEIMKNIMAKESSDFDQGVPSFQYNPVDEELPMLFELFRPLEKLESQLLKEYARKTISVEDLYKEHSIGKRYIESNYKEIFKKMLKENKIKISRPGGKKIRRDTMPGDVNITFP